MNQRPPPTNEELTHAELLMEYCKAHGLCPLAKGEPVQLRNGRFVIESFGDEFVMLRKIPGTTVVGPKEIKRLLGLEIKAVTEPFVEKAEAREEAPAVQES